VTPPSSIDPLAIAARLDRLPPSRYLWQLVFLLSIGAFFEIYDLLMTGYVSPGLFRSGAFVEGHGALFGLSDQAAFASSTFAGLWMGTLLLGSLADRFGRRAIFTFALLVYAAATFIMALQNGALGIFAWRFIAGIGIGCEMVTIDTYIAELVPGTIRGKAFAVSQGIMFCSVPTVAFLSWMLLPYRPFGIDGWRLVALFPALAAVVAWWIRRRLPESPRWLAQQGRFEEAERTMAGIEARVRHELGRELPVPVAPADEPAAAAAAAPQPPPPLAPAPNTGAQFREILQPPYRRRTVMLAVFHVFQTIGFYGFGNWVPKLLSSQGIAITSSMKYAFLIAVVYPLAPFIFTLIADRFERKRQIVVAAISTGVFGVLFARQTDPRLLIVFGVLITVSNNLMSYAYHAYQSELFPTRIRSRAVGFVYSFSRLSTIFSSFAIALVLANFGSVGVFVFIAFSMGVVVVVIACFGPRTRGLALEAIEESPRDTSPIG
jgi:MFS transporter, putative metabolite:H+ symporter